MRNFTLDRSKASLLIVDMQEKVFNTVERNCELLQTLLKVIEGCRLMHLPVYLSEQYPEGLGATIKPIREQLADQYHPLVKSAFSCIDDPAISKLVKTSLRQQWILVGIEAHICVLETAKGLLQLGHDVVVLNDSISSRSIYDYSTAIAEMRDIGVRISCAETVLFELLKDSKAPEFKQISQLIKSKCGCC